MVEQRQRRKRAFGLRRRARESDSSGITDNLKQLSRMRGSKPRSRPRQQSKKSTEAKAEDTQAQVDVPLRNAFAAMDDTVDEGGSCRNSHEETLKGVWAEGPPRLEQPDEEIPGRAPLSPLSAVRVGASWADDVSDDEA